MTGSMRTTSCVGAIERSIQSVDRRPARSINKLLLELHHSVQPDTRPAKHGFSPNPFSPSNPIRSGRPSGSFHREPLCQRDIASRQLSSAHRLTRGSSPDPSHLYHHRIVR
ncbi:hypothetical protein VTH06DRAFT_7345 [Thermothelomyces fergusii]